MNWVNVTYLANNESGFISIKQNLPVNGLAPAIVVATSKHLFNSSRYLRLLTLLAAILNLNGNVAAKDLAKLEEGAVKANLNRFLQTIKRGKVKSIDGNCSLSPCDHYDEQQALCGALVKNAKQGKAINLPEPSMSSWKNGNDAIREYLRDQLLSNSEIDINQSTAMKYLTENRKNHHIVNAIYTIPKMHGSRLPFVIMKWEYADSKFKKLRHISYIFMDKNGNRISGMAGNGSNPLGILEFQGQTYFYDTNGNVSPKKYSLYNESKTLAELFSEKASEDYLAHPDGNRDSARWDDWCSISSQ